MKIKCLVVDDEPLAREGIADYVSKIDFLELVTVCSGAVEANNFLNAHKIDLIFLDIEMPGMSGVSFVQSLIQPPMIIFTTAYPNYALAGYEVNAVDYLVKPISFERFLKAANKANEKFKTKGDSENEEEGKFIFIKTENKFLKINYEDILYIEGLKDYVKIHTAQGKQLALANLKTIGAALPENIFMRVHKSYIVSLQKISSVEGSGLKIGLVEIPIGKEFKEKLFEKLINNKLIKR